MGSYIHKVLTVTMNTDIMNARNIRAIQEYANDLFGLQVSNIHLGINYMDSFSIHSTGSKTGWEEDVKDTEKKLEFINYLDTFAFEDGSNVISYCYFEYGDSGARILKSNTEDRLGLLKGDNTVTIKISDEMNDKMNECANAQAQLDCVGCCCNICLLNN